MSHVANLRHQQALSNTPSKRRKLSDHGSTNGVNGLLDGLASKKIHATSTINAKGAQRKQADESGVTVGRGHEDTDMHEAVSASGSASSSDDEEDSDDSAEQSDAAEEALGKGHKPQLNGHTSSSQAEAGADEASASDLDDDDKDAAEPSFGDLLRSRTDADGPIDVSLSIPDTPLPHSIATQRLSTLTLPTATSLSTVLTQSLRTNDTALLESCLQVPHLDSIRSTIERLAPALASLLLQKLAERMHKRPGRAGSLMVWVQWTVVAHGGYLASQPAAMKQLQTLYNVVKQRATGLQPLLQLKGKLDMLEAQMQLRRNMQVRSLQRGEEAGVIYVEGQEDEQEKLELPSGKHARNIVVDDSEMEEDEDDMPQTLANGVSDDDDDDDEEDDEDSEDDQDLLIDDEAEVDSAEDSDALSDDIDLDEDDEEEDDDDDDEDDEGTEVIPVTKSVKLSKRR